MADDSDYIASVDTDASDTEQEEDLETEEMSITEEDIDFTVEDMYEEFDEYHNQNMLSMSSPKFYTNMLEYITDIYFTEWTEYGICTEDDYSDIYEFVEQVYENYVYYSGVPKRSVDDTSSFTPTPPSEKIAQQLTLLREIPQPPQRTKEWYEFRHNLISASNLWKVFGTDAQVNSIIYEKCHPMPPPMGGGYGSMQWGIKYEAVTVMIYEAMYRTKLEEFGCIRHPKYPYIGASPDGINVDPSSDRYGRMVEIKNIYNREINGIPKLEYWVQTQMQMETCDLDLCDFVETRIKEYPDETAFYADNENIYRGVVLSFGGDRSATVYKYMPLSVMIDREFVDEWVENTQQQMSSTSGGGLSLFSISYWYLDCFSCVLIERNKRWFEAALPTIKKTWDVIITERENGEYEKRATNTTKPKVTVSQPDADAAAAVSNSYVIRNMPAAKSVCLVKLSHV